MADLDLSDKITATVVDLIAGERKKQGLTYEELAARAGIDRSTVALWERGERSPGLGVALKVCQSLEVELSAMLAQAKDIVEGGAAKKIPVRPTRGLREADFREPAALKRVTGLKPEMLRKAIEHCHQTLDVIDFQLELHGAKPISQLVELANLSSMIGNLLAEGIAANSDGLYGRNTPHTYPDLLPLKKPAVPLEIKMALETNRPKGHLPKPGPYLTIRYVLCGKDGALRRGKENRGNTAHIWEAKVGVLQERDFDLSNTAGDSGKTAVVSTVAFDRMALVYFNPALMPYGRWRRGYGPQPLRS